MGSAGGGTLSPDPAADWHELRPLASAIPNHALAEGIGSGHNVAADLGYETSRTFIGMFKKTLVTDRSVTNAAHGQDGSTADLDQQVRVTYSSPRGGVLKAFGSGTP